MAYIEKFLGRKVEIPEDRRYFVKSGLWVKTEGDEWRFGFTEPELVLIGGVNDLEWLCRDGDEVIRGQSVAIAITGKIRYIDAPISGALRLNPEVKDSISKDPYGQGWLFQINPFGTEDDFQALPPAEEYILGLQNSEGCKNPEGLKGGVSGICKAEYTGIKEQKFEKEKPNG
jgi:glycine cleavage system H lipoate-binding protein